MPLNHTIVFSKRQLSFIPACTFVRLTWKQPTNIIEMVIELFARTKAFKAILYLQYRNGKLANKCRTVRTVYNWAKELYHRPKGFQQEIAFDSTQILWCNLNGAIWSHRISLDCPLQCGLQAWRLLVFLYVKINTFA